MSTQIAGLDYFELIFNTDGALTSDSGLGTALKAGKIKDLFVLAHGWNNSADSARKLYDSMFHLLAGMIPDKLDSSAAVGVLWPALVFPEDDPATAKAIPSTGPELAEALAPVFPGQESNLATMGRLLDEMPQDPAKLDEFHSLVSGLVTSPPLADEDAGPHAYIAGDPAAVFGAAAALTGTQGEAAEAVSNPFTALWHGAREIFRQLSYYEMKNRAGVVGRTGLGPFIGKLAADCPGIQVHLMGHSFGARLVSFALSGLPEAAAGPQSPVASLVLVQGAFSHFSFAEPVPDSAIKGPGALASFAQNVNGPLMSTFSAADRAVGFWYPRVSELAHEDSESSEDLTYRWGAMGHDGYQQSPPGITVELGPQGHDYNFKKGSFYLLDANAVIKAEVTSYGGAHTDIVHPEVVWPLASAASA